jgi:hypothetical protein
VDEAHHLSIESKYCYLLVHPISSLELFVGYVSFL